MRIKLCMYILYPLVPSITWVRLSVVLQHPGSPILQAPVETTFPMSLTARCGLVANWNRQWCIQFPDHILEREGCPSSCTQNTDRLGLSQHPRNSTTTRKKESGSLSDLKEQSCLPLTIPKACFVWSLSWLMRTALSEREMVVSEQWTWVEVSYVLNEEKNAQLGWA